MVFKEVPWSKGVGKKPDWMLGWNKAGYAPSVMQQEKCPYGRMVTIYINANMLCDYYLLKN